MENNNKKEPGKLSPMRKAIYNYLNLPSHKKFAGMQKMGFDLGSHPYDNLNDLDKQFFKFIKDNDVQEKFIAKYNPQPIETPQLSSNQSVEEAAEESIGKLSPDSYLGGKYIDQFKKGAHWKEQQSGWISKEELERRLSIAANFSKGILYVESLKIPAELLVKYKIRDADELGESIDRVHSPDYILPTVPNQ